MCVPALFLAFAAQPWPVDVTGNGLGGASDADYADQVVEQRRQLVAEGVPDRVSALLAAAEDFGARRGAPQAARSTAIDDGALAPARIVLPLPKPASALAWFSPGSLQIGVSRRLLEQHRHPGFALATEVAHAMSWRRWSTAMRSRRHMWVYEGVADAFGAYFLEQAEGIPVVQPLYSPSGFDGFVRRPKYDLSLDEVSSDLLFTEMQLSGPDGMGIRGIDAFVTKTVIQKYARGHFFAHLAADLEPAEPATFLGDMMNFPLASKRSAALRMVDQMIERRGADGLAAYFPRFVRDHASERRFYRERAIGRPVAFVARDPGAEREIPSTVEPLAADPHEIDVSFEGPSWQELKDDERLWAVRTILRDASGDDEALSIVVDDDVLVRRGPYFRLAAVEPGAPPVPMFLRVATSPRSPGGRRSRTTPRG